MSDFEDETQLSNSDKEASLSTESIADGNATAIVTAHSVERAEALRSSKRETRLALKERENEIVKLTQKLMQVISAQQQRNEEILSEVDNKTAMQLNEFLTEIDEVTSSVEHILYQIKSLNDNKVEPKTQTLVDQYNSDVEIVKDYQRQRQETENKEQEEEQKLEAAELEVKEAKKRLEQEMEQLEQEMAARRARIKEKMRNIQSSAQKRQVSNIHPQQPQVSNLTGFADSSQVSLQQQDLNPSAQIHISRQSSEIRLLPSSQQVNDVAHSQVPAIPSARQVGIDRQYSPVLISDSPNSTNLQTPPEFKPTQTYDPPSEIAKAITDHMHVSLVAPPEPSIFFGDPLQYADWRISFDSLIDSKVGTPMEKLHRLRKYVAGDALDSISGYFRLQTANAYQNALDTLREEFGRDELVEDSFRDKLESYAKISGKDHQALKRYSYFLKQCLAAQAAIPSLRVLDDKRENKKFIRALPEWLISRWTRYVTDEQDKRGFPPFSKYVDFVAHEAKVASNNLRDMNNSKPQSNRPMENNSSSRPQNFNRNLRNFHTNARRDELCLYCGKTNHSVAECFGLGRLSYPDRDNFVRQHSLCYSCLLTGHQKQNCRQRAKCKKCYKLHPTSLHKEPSDWEIKRQSSNANTGGPIERDYRSGTVAEPARTSVSVRRSEETNQENAKKLTVKTMNLTGNILTMAVPVHISTEENPQKETLVYALLDTQSDSSYITTNAAGSLKLTSSQEQVIIGTMTSESSMKLDRYHNIRIRGYNESKSTTLSAYGWESIPCEISHIPNQVNVAELPHLKDHAHKLPPPLDIEIGLLIGGNCPEAFAPLDVILGEVGKPFAQKTMLGWTVFGAKDTNQHQQKRSRINKTMLTTEDQLISQEDIKFLDIMENGVKTMKDGSYQLPLPFKKKPNMPDNRLQTEKRLMALKKKFEEDKAFEEEYNDFMNELISNGHAEPVDSKNSVQHGEMWYIPHFAVTHPKKKKTRVVFDCSAKYKNTSLNEHLLQGPDMMNSLVGILCRFRKEEIAISCDIEKMFYNFYVDEEDRDYLRFLWLIDGIVKEFRMTVHLFGATSSPAVATYGLRKLAQNHQDQFPVAARFIERNFYVDDGITSVANVEDAKRLINDAREVCAKGNLRLHKFICNDREVLSYIPETEKTIQEIDLFRDNLSTQRTLGLEWALDTDMLKFKSSHVQDKPVTKRGILSTVSQIFDPLGLLSPFILLGKNILQQVNQSGVDWDEEISGDLQGRWKVWLAQLVGLDKITISRCIKPLGFGTVIRTELHHFCDASTHGIGACSYIRLINTSNEVHCALLLGKSRVIPKKGKVTIPRLELQGAILATQLSATLHRELDMGIDAEHFWTDSAIVLGYLTNDSKRFQVYVANRIHEIRLQSNPDQWHHIQGDENPADIASRGANCDKLITSKWFTGPSLLASDDQLLDRFQSDNKVSRSVSTDDPELKKVKSVKITSNRKAIYNKLGKFGTLRSLVKSIAILQQIIINKSWKKHFIKAEHLENAEKFIIQTTQEKHFAESLQELKDGKISNNLKKLSPFLDKDGIMRIGGRAQQSMSLSFTEKHPVILPFDSHVSKLIVLHYHHKVFHMGKTTTLGAIRESGFWIIGSNRLVKSTICTIQNIT